MRETTETTLVTLSTGRILEVQGSYEDVRATLAPRTLSPEDGRRELRQVSGSPIEITTQAVLSVEPEPETETRIGFR